MNRSLYFDYIEGKLNFLAFRIEKRGKINLLDLNIHCETFFEDMLNMLFDLQLENLNKVKQNVEGIDLVDSQNRIVAQVSATCTKQKIEYSLSKEILKDYKGYRFKFVSIASDANKKLRESTFDNPHGMLFSPEYDIIDNKVISNTVLGMLIDKQKSFYEFIKNELGDEIDIVKFDSNLATIINILASEDLTNTIEPPEINSFEIERKIKFNDLMPVQDIIGENKVYYTKLNEKYKEFDKQGVNKSFSVLNVIRTQYIKFLAEGKQSSDLFFAIIYSVIDIIIKSKNYIEIPYDELEMCVHIVVVDAFIKCKIFKNPEGYNNVVAK